MQDPRFMDPTRRVRLYDLDSFCYSERSWETNKEVNVIVCAVNVQGGTLQLSDNSAHISEYILSPLCTKVREAIFCAEDDMRQKIGVRMPHARGLLKKGKGWMDYTESAKKSFGPEGPHIPNEMKTTALLAASRCRARASRSRGYNLTPLRG
jgi:hypothetical protein